ncbi:uncharacterized protein LOC144637661 [Oculina patagonica]
MKTLVLLCLVVLLPAVSTSCIDKHASCQYWALRGECTNNPGYMNANCCLWCNHVNQLKSKSCTNSNGNCQNWANTGECCKNPAYMLDFCCAACRAKGYTLP